MTRLNADMIRDVPSSLEALDRELLCSTGASLSELAARTVALPSEAVAGDLLRSTAAVVPISSGQGIIDGFAEAVAAIVRFIGVPSFVTRRADVAGIGEALGRGADILFMADDDAFIALNLRTGSVTDNAAATAAGFVHALAAAAERAGGKGLLRRKVLVLGLGPVGRHAAREAQALGAQVTVYDSDAVRLHAVVRQQGSLRTADDIRRAMEDIDYVIDATPASGIIDEHMIRPDTVISCPGVPHGLTPAALEKAGAGFIHDNLALGVAVMAVQSIIGVRGVRGVQGVRGCGHSA